MLYRVLFVLSSAFWLVMTGLLVQREILPRYESTGAGRGYEGLLSGVEEPRYTRMAILAFDSAQGELVQIGASETETIPEADGTYRIVARTQVGKAPGILQFVGKHESEIEMVVGRDYRLKTIHVRMVGLGMTLVQDGMVQGDHLHLKTELNGHVHEETVDARDHPLFSDAYGAFEMPRDLAVGRSWEAVRINPLTRRRTIYEAEVVGVEENFLWDGGRERVFVVEVNDRERMTHVKSFVTPDGRVLEQHLPLGLVLRLEESRP